MVKHVFIKTKDFRRAVASLLKKNEQARLHWMEQERGWEAGDYIQGYELWLDRVDTHGTSPSGVSYKTLLWEKWTENRWMDANFLEPLSKKLSVSSGSLLNICAPKDKVGKDGWPASEEVALVYAETTPQKASNRKKVKRQKRKGRK